MTGIEELNVHHLTLVKKGWLRAFSFSKRHQILLQDVTMSKDMEEKEDERSDKGLLLIQVIIRCIFMV